MLRQGSDSLIEGQIKYISERVKNTEKYSTQLRTVISDIAHREAELRDKYDEVSRICKDLAEADKGDLTLVTSLNAISNTFTMLADNKNIEAQRLVVHVESEFAQYGTICKKIKENLKECSSTKDPVSRQRRGGLEVATLDSKMMKTNVDTKRILHELCDTFETFEQRKLQDFKSVFHNLLLIILKANVSAIDPLTYSTKTILDVDESTDLKKIKESFQNLSGDNKNRKFRSRSMSALSSLFKSGKKPAFSQSSTSINSNETPIASVRNTGRPHRDISDKYADEDDEDKSQSDSESSVSSDQERLKKRK